MTNRLRSSWQLRLHAGSIQMTLLLKALLWLGEGPRCSIGKAQCTRRLNRRSYYRYLGISPGARWTREASSAVGCACRKGYFAVIERNSRMFESFLSLVRHAVFQELQFKGAGLAIALAEDSAGKMKSVTGGLDCAGLSIYPVFAIGYMLVVKARLVCCVGT